MNLKTLSTFGLLAALTLPLVGGCSGDAGGPSPEERAAKMDKAREGMMHQGPQGQAAVK